MNILNFPPTVQVFCKWFVIPFSLNFLLIYGFLAYAQEFTIPITVTDGKIEQELIIGIHPDGSDEYVQGLDSFAPPPPPAGAFDARITHLSEHYFTKILDNELVEKIFNIRSQVSEGQQEIQINWDAASLSELFSFTMTDDSTVTDMKNDTSFVPKNDQTGRPLPVQIVLKPKDESPQPPGAPDLVSPENESVDQATEPVLIWTGVVQAAGYRLQVAKDINFTTIVIDEEVVGDTTYQATDLQEGMTYYWRVKANNEAGPGDWSEVREFTTQISTHTGDTQNGIPDDFALYQNYPNPFNSSTTIRYALPEDTHVKLEVYNLLGQRISVLVDERQTSGYYTIRFSGSPLTSNVYIYRIRAGGFDKSRKLMYIK